MKKITNLLLLMIFMSSMVLMGQTSAINSNSDEEAQMRQQRRAPSLNAQTQALPAHKLNAKGSTFTVPGNGSRAVSNIKIEVSVDYWIGEASYNLWSYADNAYYWATDQTFASTYETITHVLPLTEGGAYSVDCFDSYGDGGIGGVVSNDDTGWFIMNWADNEYTDVGEFNFTAWEGFSPPVYVPVTTFPFLADFEVGVLTGDQYLEPVTDVQSGAYLSAYAADASSFGFMMEGGSSSDGWTGGSTSTTYDEAFTDNVTHHSELLMEVHPDLADPGYLFMTFDFRQNSSFGYAYEWFRLLVDGTPIADINGDTYWNPTTDGADPFQTLTFDLTPFKNLASFEITFQNSAKYYYGYSTDGDVAMIDNVGLFYSVPGLEILNKALDMGDRPIGAWMQPASYEFVNNPGLGDISIANVDIDESFGGFLTVTNPTLPFVLGSGATTTEFGISTTEEVVADGAFAGNFAVFYSEARAITHATYSGNAYTPVAGDVWELALDGNAAAYPVNVPMGTFYDNYTMPGADTDGWDVVYTYTFATDVVFNSTLTATDAKMAIYPVGFEGVGGPDMDNELFTGTTALVDIELSAGTYYMAVSTTGADYDLDVTFPDMPAPDAATYVAPFDGETGIANGDELTWTFGANTVEYQVIIGTTYPPTDVVVDWTDDLATAYALVDLVPNLQYFWQVNTGNSTGTTDGDIWGFTATITPPSGLVATLTDLGESFPTVDVSLVWDAPTTRAFLGYNVFRGGVQLNTDLITVESYSDLGLARDMSYTYYVTSVFDQGESVPSNEVTVTALGVGTFNGVVTNALNDTLIPGASVNIFGDDYSYFLTTNADGEYSTLAYTGTYELAASFENFNSATAGPIVLAHGVTETTDFALTETPLPVGDVVAEEMNEDQVHVHWTNSAPEPIMEWLMYGEGTHTNNWWLGDGAAFSTAINFDPIDLVDLDGTSLTKFSIYNFNADNTTEATLMIYEGDLVGETATLLYEQPIVDLLPSDWNEITLTTPIPIDVSQQLWIVVNRPSAHAGTSASDSESNLKGDWVYYNGAWVNMSIAWGIPNVWNMAVFATDVLTNRTTEIVRREQTPLKGVTGNAQLEDLIVETDINNTPFRPEFNSRGVVSYDVYRSTVYRPEAAILVGNTIQMDFVDFDWGIQDWGVYRWSVVVNYDEGQVSEPTYSNTLETDMEILVSAMVSTNSGDSPAGTSVVFTNTSELDEEGLPIYVFEASLNDLGFVEWADFRRGTYDIAVSLPGFTSVNETGIDIFEDEDFEWMLEEILSTPGELYVTPTGWATWVGNTGGGGSDGYFSDFEADDGGWTVGGSPASWQWGAPADDPINFAFSGSNVWMTDLTANYVNNSDMWIQREFDFSDSQNPYISLQLFMWSENNYDAMVLEYSTDGGATWTKIAEDQDPQMFYNSTSNSGNLDAPKWSGHTIEDYQFVETMMPEVAGMANVILRFRFNSDSSVTYEGFAIDNVTVSDMTRSSKSSLRAFEAYKVYLDGALITETGDTEYQYGTEGEVLVAGETYTAGVAAIFTMGQSATAEFDWIYVPCDEYDAPTAFTAAQDEGTLDITLGWTNVDAAALDTIDGVLVYRDGDLYDAVDFATGVVNSYTDGPLEFGTYSYCITYIYASGAETCQGVVCSGDVEIDGNAAVDGFVFQDAYLGGAPIEGAEVYIVNVDFPEIDFSFDADDTGAYGGSVIAGTYDYTVSAWGYITETLEGVVIPLNGTVTNTFELDEFPAPPVNVVATELTDDEVLVEWNNPQFSQFEPYTADMSAGVPAGWTIDPAAMPTWFWTDNAGGNQLGGKAFMFADSDAAGSGTFMAVSMTTPVIEYTMGQALILLTFDQYFNTGWDPNAYADVEVFDGSDWVVVAHQTADMGSWTSPNHQSIDVTAYANADFAVRFFYTATWDWYWAVNNVVVTNAVTRTGEPVLTSKPIPTRDMTGYEIYRTTCETGDLQFMGMVPATDSVFTDHTWGAASPNVYKWGVVALYEQNDSEIAFSNCLDKNMYTDVTVTVTTNDSHPEGTFVQFTNISEPGLGYNYVTLLDETGFYAWDDFRLGDYDIFVEKPGFEAIEIFGEPIWEATDFAWFLEEEILPVGDLHVNPVAFATWTGAEPPPPPPPPGPTVIIEENFDTYTAGDFVAVVSPVFTTWSGNAGGADDAYISDLQSSSPANSVEVELNDDLVLIMEDYTTGFYTYEMKMYVPSGFCGYFNLQKTSTPGQEWAFQMYYQTDGIAIGDAGAAGSVNHTFNHDVWMDLKVEVDLDNDWATYYFNGEEIIGYQWTLGTFGTPGLNSFGGVNLFGGSNSTTTDTPLYFFDNVLLTTPAETRASRELEYYKVWLDGIFVENTVDSFYQYDVTDLISGQEYYSEVAAMYTNGMSERMDYYWTYMPCDSFPGPGNLAGELQDVNDVLLTWSNTGGNPPSPGELVEITQNPGAAANGYYQSYGSGYGVVYDLSDYPDALANSIEFHHASWGVSGPHDYNIHIIDWNTEATIAVLGPFITTGDDQWEVEIDLGDVNLLGATDVAFLMEPLSNSASDAYPDISSDDAANPQGSVFGPLDDVASIGSSEIGNFLMNIFIMTSNGTRVMAPKSLDLPVAVNAIPRFNANNAFVNAVIDNQTATVVNQVAELTETTFVNSDVDQNAEPRTVETSRAFWDVQYNFDIEGPSGLTGLAGGESDGEFIYATKWAGSEIVKFTVDGSYVETFSIPGVSGLRDLAFDGTYMYGAAASTTVYKMDFSTQSLVSSFNAPTAVRAIAYDEDDNAFWGNNWDSDLVKFDESGATLATISGPPSMYGMAYDNFTVGGPFLWVFTGTTTGGGAQIEQIDIATGNLTGLSHSVSDDFGAYIAGGLYIIEDLVTGKRTIGGTAQGEPSIAFGYELGDTGGGGGGGGNAGPVLGANVYRDGLLIAEMVQDTFYVDMALDYGMYEYCVTLVYEELAESCMDDCVDVEVTEDCIAPEELTATVDVVGTDSFVNLLWDQQDVIAEWLFYDDGVNVDGIGGPATFIWAVKFDPAQLTDLDGTSLTKISIYNRTSDVNTLQIFEGSGAGTLLFEQDLIGLDLEAWNEVELTSPVEIDITKELWIGVNTTAGAGYPAGCGNATGNPNGDLISQDGGASWEHLTDFGLMYTWNLRGYVTNEFGREVAITPVVNNNVVNAVADATPFISTGVVNTSDDAVLTVDSDASRSWLGYNIYKDGEMIEALWPDNFYTYLEHQIGYYCYTVTSEYSFCGESDPSNEACADIIVGIDELTASDVSLYPNPAKDMVTVTSTMPMTRLSVTNYIGQTVYSEVSTTNKVVLDTQSYLSGVYLVKIETENGVVTKRVIITK